jgi:hypothetical protein
MVAKHAWDKVVTRRRSRSGWAIRLFAAAGTAFLVFIVGVSVSGGGLGRGTLSEPMNTVAVAITWAALLAFVVLLPLAALTGLVSVVGSWTAPASAASSEDDQPLGVPKTEIGPEGSERQVTLRDRRRPDGEASTFGSVATTADRRRQTRALLALVALTIAAAYLWGDRGEPLTRSHALRASRAGF